MTSQITDNFIPLSVPNLSGNELKYVSETITSGWVSSVGSYVDRFEKEFAQYVGTRYAVAVMNGTAALHLCLLLSGVKANDEVLMPNLTFVATANAVLYCHAHPVFIDSEWGTLGIDVDKLATFLKQETLQTPTGTINKKTKRRIKAIIPMHTLGIPVDMAPLMELAEKYQLKVIEDATESLGSEYRGKKTGNLADIACFSFNGNKIITTGGGGMITTNDPELAQRAKHLSTTAKTDAIEFDHDEIGYNYRLVNILAAVGVAQLERIEEFVEIKRANFLKYKKLLAPLELFTLHSGSIHSHANYWMYALILNDLDHYSVNGVIADLAKNHIQARPLWKLMNTLSIFKHFQSYHCENSVEMRKKIICIPCSTSLTQEQIERVASVIGQIK